MGTAPPKATLIVLWLSRIHNILAMFLPNPQPRAYSELAAYRNRLTKRHLLSKTQVLLFLYLTFHFEHLNSA